LSWADDTLAILADSGSVTVTVYSASFSHTSTIPAIETGRTLVESSTVYLFPRQGELVKDERGQVIDKLDMIVFPQTTSVAVTHRIYESGTTNYYEVKLVKDYLGHKEIHAKHVEGRYGATG
jgi:hypothetical protein